MGAAPLLLAPRPTDNSLLAADYNCKNDVDAMRRCLATETGRECHDGKDNDGDGRFDCEDPDCQKQDVCRNAEYGMKKCFDGKDNDGANRFTTEDGVVLTRAPRGQAMGALTATTTTAGRTRSPPKSAPTRRPAESAPTAATTT